jgi:hypothetical protein
MRGKKLSGNEKFGGADVGFAIERINLSEGTFTFRRMTQDEMPNFVRECETLPMRMMIGVHSYQFVLRAEQARERFARRVDADDLKSKLLCNLFDSYRGGKRLDAILHERMLRRTYAPDECFGRNRHTAPMTQGVADIVFPP